MICTRPTPRLVCRCAVVLFLFHGMGPYTDFQDRVECCSDFVLEDGVCIPCIGRYGKDCNQPCECGHFGFGCRFKCNCSDTQRCDIKLGCVDLSCTSDDCDCSKSYTGEIIGAVGFVFGILCLCVAGVLTRRAKLFYEKKYNDNETVTNKEVQQTHQEYLTPISTKNKTELSSEARQRRTNSNRYQTTEVEHELHEYDPLHEGQLRDPSSGLTEITQDRHSYEEPRSRYQEISDYQHLREDRERKQHHYTQIPGASTSRM